MDGMVDGVTVAQLWQRPMKAGREFSNSTFSTYHELSHLNTMILPRKSDSNPSLAGSVLVSGRE